MTFTPLTGNYIEILFILGEVCFLLLAFILLKWLVGITFHYLDKIYWLQGKKDKLLNQRQRIERIFILTRGGLSLLLVVGNGLLIYQGKNIIEYQLNLIRSIPPQFWIMAFSAIAKSTILIILVNYSIPYLHSFIDFACIQAQNFDDISGNDKSIADFFNYLKKTITHNIWILVSIFCSIFLQMPGIVTKYLYLALEAYVVIAIGFLVVKTFSAIIDTIDELATRNYNPDSLLQFYQPFRHLVVMFKKCLEYIIYVGVATIIIGQIDSLTWIVAYGNKVIQIIGILFISSVGIYLANIILEDLVLKAENLTELQRQKRLTIIPLFKNLIKYVIYFTAAISILKLIGVDVTPVLAGAGILGIAIGFGAQNFINDLVCGFFILFENYYLVGDYIEVNSASGIVELIDLRATRIRHIDGQVYIIRNGDIKDIINYSKNYIYAVVEIGVPYDVNIEKVYTAIESLGKELKVNYQEVLEPTRVDGLEKFEEQNLIIRTATKVKAGNKFPIERAFRKMIKDTFDREGIAIRFSPKN